MSSNLQLAVVGTTQTSDIRGDTQFASGVTNIRASGIVNAGATAVKLPSTVSNATNTALRPGRAPRLIHSHCKMNVLALF